MSKASDKSKKLNQLYLKTYKKELNSGSTLICTECGDIQRGDDGAMEYLCIYCFYKMNEK